MKTSSHIYSQDFLLSTKVDCWFQYFHFKACQIYKVETSLYDVHLYHPHSHFSFSFWILNSKLNYQLHNYCIWFCSLSVSHFPLTHQQVTKFKKKVLIALQKTNYFSRFWICCSHKICILVFESSENENLKFLSLNIHNLNHRS